MKDYTEIFSNALNESGGYNIEKVAKSFNSKKNLYCGEIEPCYYNSYFILANDDLYGYICTEYPVALLTNETSEIINNVLAQNHVLFTQLIEPMSCDEKILRKFVRKKVFNEHFVDDGNFSFDDERFVLLLQRLETGYKTYIDSSNFMMSEIQYY